MIRGISKLRNTMAFGHAFSGVSKNEYTFVRMRGPETDIVQGGIILITGNNTQKPEFIGAVESLNGWFKNMGLWSKVGLIPAPAIFFIMPCGDPNERAKALADLLSRFSPPINAA